MGRGQGSWADQSDDDVDVVPSAFRFRGRRVAFSARHETIEVPDQFGTYGFDVREFDIGPEGLMRRSRISRELRDLRR